MDTYGDGWDFHWEILASSPILNESFPEMPNSSPALDFGSGMVQSSVNGVFGGFVDNHNVPAPPLVPDRDDFSHPNFSTVSPSEISMEMDKILVNQLEFGSVYPTLKEDEFTCYRHPIALAEQMETAHQHSNSMVFVQPCQPQDFIALSQGNACFNNTTYPTSVFSTVFYQPLNFPVFQEPAPPPLFPVFQEPAPPPLFPVFQEPAPPPLQHLQPNVPYFYDQAGAVEENCAITRNVGHPVQYEVGNGGQVDDNPQTYDGLVERNDLLKSNDVNAVASAIDVNEICAESGIGPAHLLDMGFPELFNCPEFNEFRNMNFNFADDLNLDDGEVQGQQKEDCSIGPNDFLRMDDDTKPDAEHDVVEKQAEAEILPTKRMRVCRTRGGRWRSSYRARLTSTSSSSDTTDNEGSEYSPSSDENMLSDTAAYNNCSSKSGSKGKRSSKPSAPRNRSEVGVWPLMRLISAVIDASALGNEPEILQFCRSPLFKFNKNPSFNFSTIREGVDRLSRNDLGPKKTKLDIKPRINWNEWDSQLYETNFEEDENARKDALYYVSKYGIQYDGIEDDDQDVVILKTDEESLLRIPRRLEVDGKPNFSPTVLTSVGSAYLNVKLDLKGIAEVCNNIEFLDSMTPLMLTLREPRCYGLLYDNGRLLVLGAKTRADLRIGTRKFARIVQKVGYDVQLKNICMNLLIGWVKLNFKVNIKAMSKHPKLAPSLSVDVKSLNPGVVFKVEETGAIVFVLQNGSMLISEVSTDQKLKETLDLIYPCLRDFGY